MTLFLLGHSGVAGAQSASTITDSASRILSADTLKSAKKESDTATGWAGAPYVEYAPETRLVGGFVRRDPERRRADLRVSLGEDLIPRNINSQAQ